MTGQQTNAAYVAAAEAPMRPLTVRRMRPTERRLLASKLRTSTLPVRLHQRYRIVGEVTRGRTGAEIADRVGCTLKAVRRWLHRFNASGFETFERPTNPWGREPILLGPQVRELVKVALSRPADLGLPFTEWSTAKLTAYCKQRGLLPGRWCRTSHRSGSISTICGACSRRTSKRLAGFSLWASIASCCEGTRTGTCGPRCVGTWPGSCS